MDGDTAPALVAGEQRIDGLIRRRDHELVGIDEGDPVEFQLVGLAGSLVSGNLGSAGAIRPEMVADIVQGGGGLDDGVGAVIGAVVEDDLGVEAGQGMEGDPFGDVAGFVAHDQADGGFHGTPETWHKKERPSFLKKRSKKL